MTAMPEFKYTVVRIGVHPRDTMEPERIELERVGARHVVAPYTDDPDEVLEAARHADGVIDRESPMPRRVIEALERCKVILRTGIGVDVVDVDAATELGIAVVNLPDLWIKEVANHAFALMLACNRRLLVLDRDIRGGRWEPITPSPVGSLHGETVGLVGLGNTGRVFARRAAAFEMDVIAADPYVPDAVFAEYGVERVGFDELLARSDYVSVHCPRTEETFHLFDEAAFRAMKSTAYLINTARGPIVEHAALVRALTEGWIEGAGLDVQEFEPPGPDDPLMKLDNVVLTPHTAYFSDPAISSVPVRCGQEVARVLTGRMPLNLVNPDVLSKLPLKSD